MKKLLSLICVLSLALACSACGQEPNPAGISLEEFEKISTGMSLTEAEEIFGGSIELGTVQLVSETDNSKDGYYENISVYKVIGETSGYAELEFTYHKDHMDLHPSIDGLTSKTQYNLSYTQQSNIEADNSIVTESHMEETTTVETSQETTEFDYSNLSNEEFAEKIANDFSTDDVTFTIREYSDTVCFLDTNNENVRAHIGFSDYGNNIMLTLITDGGEDECYYVLLKALQSEVFNIPLDDQIDILAHYTVDEIDYKNGSLRITESSDDNIRVIGIRL